MRPPRQIRRYKAEFLAELRPSYRRQAEWRINRYLGFLGVPDEARITALVHGDIEATLDRYIEQRNRVVSPSTWRPEVSLIKKFIKGAAVQAFLDTPECFADALNAAMLSRGESPKSLARKARVRYPQLIKYLRNYRQPKDCAVTERLEAALELEPGSLMSWLPYRYRRKPAERRTTVFQQKQRTRTRYRLNVLPEPIEALVSDVIRFRTARHVPFGMKRDRSNIWRRHEDGCAAAEQYRASVSAFYGCLVVDRGFKIDDLSVAHMFDPELWAGLIEFLERRLGPRGRTVSLMISHLPPLLKRTTGFLWQRDDLRHIWREGATVEEWRAHCEALAEHFTYVKRDLEIEAVKTRNPRVDLQDILNLEAPTSVLRTLLSRMLKARPATVERMNVPTAEALWALRCLLVRFMNWMPLRSRNWRIMTWRPDNTGHLYQRADKSWWLRFSAHEFKPKQRSKDDEHFDVEISETLWAPIESFLKNHRPLIWGAADTDVVFLSGRPQKKSRDGRYTSGTFSRMILDLTRQFLPEYPGFSPHAWRHIFVSDWLKNNPEEILVAAHMLNDSWEVVKEWYAHLQFNDMIKRWTRHHDAVVKAAGLAPEAIPQAQLEVVTPAPKRSWLFGKVGPEFRHARA